MPTPGEPTTTATRTSKPSAGALQRPPKRGELALASDEPRILALLEGRRDRAQLDEPIREHRLALALDRDLAQRIQHRDMVDQPRGERADDDLVRAGSCFEPRRDADRLAGDEPLSRVRRRRDNLAGLDPDPELEADAVLRARAAR